MDQLLNIISKITKAKYQSHTHKNLCEKIKRKKPQEILQIKITIVKSTIKFQIYQSYVCLKAKEKSHYFFSLTHYFSSWLRLTTKPYSFFTTMHIASSLSFLLHFATLIKVTYSHWFVRFTKFVVNNTQILMSPCLPHKDNPKIINLIFPSSTSKSN